MSPSKPSKVFLFDNSDPEMQNAYEKARATFRYFWRELSWEYRRIVPALDLAYVKAPFYDRQPQSPEDRPEVEHMWIDEVNFDGQQVSGVLLNTPNSLTSVEAGDKVSMPLSDISDWMYAINGTVYGAFTVNLMRSRMSPRERKEHDQAWGLNFGDPDHIAIVPSPKKSGGLLKSLFGGRSESSSASTNEPIGEHPMSINMAAAMEEQLTKNPSLLTDADEQGWTLLHNQALAGSEPTVRILLARGADRNARTKQGQTPLDLARSLGWEKVVALLNGN